MKRFRLVRHGENGARTTVAESVDMTVEEASAVNVSFCAAKLMLRLWGHASGCSCCSSKEKN